MWSKGAHHVPIYFYDIFYEILTFLVPNIGLVGLAFYLIEQLDIQRFIQPLKIFTSMASSLLITHSLIHSLSLSHITHHSSLITHHSLHHTHTHFFIDFPPLPLVHSIPYSLTHSHTHTLTRSSCTPPVYTTPTHTNPPSSTSPSHPHPHSTPNAPDI
jgi:hypothetical protein